MKLIATTLNLEIALPYIKREKPDSPCFSFEIFNGNYVPELLLNFQSIYKGINFIYETTCSSWNKPIHTQLRHRRAPNSNTADHIAGCRNIIPAMSIRRWSVYEEHAKKKNGNDGRKGSQASLSSLNIRPVTRKKAVKRAKGKKKWVSNAERRSAKVTNNAQRSMETCSAPLKTLATFLLAVTVFPSSTPLSSSLFVSLMLATRSKGWSKMVRDRVSTSHFWRDKSEKEGLKQTTEDGAVLVGYNFERKHVDRRNLCLGEGLTSLDWRVMSSSFDFGSLERYLNPWNARLS